jgi:polysaccharide biosynthesis protein PslH
VTAPLKVLYIVPYSPSRIRTRPYHLIRALLSEGHRVTIAAAADADGRFGIPSDLTKQADGVIAERVGQLQSGYNSLRALFTSGPLQASYSWSPRLAARIAAAVRGGGFDVVHVEHLRAVRYGLCLKAGMTSDLTRLPVIWDSVDCISSLFRQTLTESCAFRSRIAARLELRRTERLEARMPASFDRVLVTSEVDRSELLKLAAERGYGGAEELSRRVIVVPNGVDAHYFAPGAERREPLTLAISGKMSYHANITAVVRFIADVMPAVWSVLPGVRLSIVGKDPPPEVRRLAAPGRVVVTGTVEDIRPFLRSATIAVAPIRYGAGVQNKVLEAMACGTPVVATATAAAGLHVCPGHDIAVTHSDRELAGAIVGLLQDPARCLGLGLSGRATVERQYAWGRIGRQLADVYRNAISANQAVAAAV